MAKNCNSGWATYGKPQASPGYHSFIREKGSLEGCYKQTIPLEETGSSKCSGFSLAGLLPGEEKSFLPPAGSGVVTFFLLECRAVSLAVSCAIDPEG